jgi:hypothetical protein
LRRSPSIVAGSSKPPETASSSVKGTVNSANAPGLLTAAELRKPRRLEWPLPILHGDRTKVGFGSNLAALAQPSERPVCDHQTAVGSADRDRPSQVESRPARRPASVARWAMSWAPASRVRVDPALAVRPPSAQPCRWLRIRPRTARHPSSPFPHRGRGLLRGKTRQRHVQPPPASRDRLHPSSATLRRLNRPRIVSWPA